MADVGDTWLRRARSTRARLSLLAVPETPAAEWVTCLALVLVVALIGLLAGVVGADVVPPALAFIPVIIGGLALPPRPLRVLFVATAVELGFAVAAFGWSGVRVGGLVGVVAAAVIANEMSRSRDVLGLSATRRESMLVELRDRLRAQGEMPVLPAPWHAEVVQRSAGGGDFGGDFMVSTLADDGSRLELALVDVSGKGVDAGTRALLLSGALGGLLGAVPPEDFLAAANDYLVRQGWPEGFATAVHVTLDLRDGSYRLAMAGHPPPAHFSGGSGRWRLVQLDGLVLGVSQAPSFGEEKGVLRPYDALLLYTDGLVEVPGRDLALGIDRLLGEAERLIPRGFTGGAERLTDAVAPHAADDRALVLLWRT